MTQFAETSASSPSRRGSIFGSNKIQNALSADDVKQWNYALLESTLTILFSRSFLGLMQNLDKSTSDESLLKSLYDYWPLLSKMNPSITQVFKESTTIQSLLSLPVFLSEGKFVQISDTCLPTKTFPSEVLRYIALLTRVASCPPNIAQELTDPKAFPHKHNQLSPSALRQHLRGSSQKVNVSRNVLYSILSFAVQDMDEFKSAELFARQKKYKELNRNNMLPMADGTVRKFPNSKADRVITAPLSLQCLITGVRRQSVEPFLARIIPIFQDNDFLDALFIERFNPSIFADVAPEVLPSDFKRLPAVAWENESFPSKLVLYSLWKDCFSFESSISTFDSMKEWPILPVRLADSGKKLLMSIDFLPYLFFTQQSPADADADFESRSILEKDMQSIELDENAKNKENVESISSYLLNMGDLKTDSVNIKFITRTYSRREVSTENYLDAKNTAKDAVAVEISAGGGSAVAAGGGGGSGEIIMAQVSHTVTATATAVTSAPNNSVVTVIGAASSNPNPNSDAHENSNVLSDADLIETLLKLNYPFLDSSVLCGPPLILRNQVMHVGKRLLLGLNKIMQFSASNLSSGDEVSSDSFLKFSSLSNENRKKMLLTIYSSHRDQQLNAAELDCLRQLPLFVSIDNAPVTVKDYTKAYFCRNLSVISDLKILKPDDMLSSVSLKSKESVILAFDPLYTDIYQTLNIEELTAATAASAFILPYLKSISGMERLRVISELSTSWLTYKTNKAFVDSLKEIPFVPSWNEETKAVDFMRLRLASDIFNWKDEELLTALKGQHEPLYFPPPHEKMRSEAMHTLMRDLDMPVDLTSKNLVRVCRDIEDFYRACSSSSSSSSNEKSLAAGGGSQAAPSISADDLAVVFDRSKRILRYINSESRAVHIDKESAKTLSKISFVPVDFPGNNHATNNK
jgi:hypothetical protein